MKASSRFFIFIGITLAILIAYAIPFQKMGVDSDFFGVLQDVRLTTSWHSFWQGCLAQTYYSLNETRTGTHFLSFYRPIAQHLHLIESYFFGNWWYGYTLGAITFFGMTAGILGVIFSYFYAPLDAIILALLWATHPALSPSLLSVTVLLSSAYFFIALSALFYIWYFKDKQIFFYVFSLILYAFGALSYDLVIIAPLSLFFFLLFFYHTRLYEIIPYFMVTLSCIGLRFCLIEGSPHYLKDGLWPIITMMITNVIQTLRPFWGLQYSSTLVALFVTIIFAGLITWYFIKNSNQRLFILWLISSFIFCSWGILIGNSSSRYFCLGLPFFNILVYLLANYFFSKKKATFFLLFLILLGGTRTIYNFSCREKYTQARDTALHQVLKDYPDEQYLFLTTPHFCKHEIFLLSSGLMQALQLLSGNNNIAVYHLVQLLICTMDFPSQGTITTEYIPQGYRFKVTDPSHIWFMVPSNVDKIDFLMGTIIINQRISNWQATDVSLLLNKTYRTQKWLNKTTILAWDPHLWKFVLCQKQHILQTKEEINE